MNIEEYISTGILEAYALNELPEAERAQVERDIAVSPALKQELLKIEATMEAFAMEAAVAPRADVKAKLMAKVVMEKGAVTDTNRNNDANVRILTPPASYWRYATAASIVLALITSYLAINYRQLWMETRTSLDNLIAQNQQIAQDYSQVNHKLDKIQKDLLIIENTAFKKVIMKGTDNEPGALASVYWNASTEEVFISIQNLKAIAKENQFQLWAIVDGKPVDAGVFDGGMDGLLKMKNIKGAAAFAVTVEPRGGKPSPSLETMRVMGPVQG